MIAILDPDPDNQLGKGILNPTLEAELLAEGVIFAIRFPPRKGKPFWSLLVCKRPIADAVTDGELDRRQSQRRVPVAVMPIS